MDRVPAATEPGQFIPMTRTVDLGNGVRGIDGFVPITSPYYKTEMKLVARAVADLARGGIDWRFGDDGRIYRETHGARPIEDDGEDEEP